MDAQWFAIVKAELKKPLLLDDLEDGEEETVEEVEDHQSLGLAQAQKEFEDMQKSFERMMQKQKELRDQARANLEHVQESQGMRDTTSSAMKTNFDISNAF